jgi:cell division protein YceG involved in septum cleavage
MRRALLTLLGLVLIAAGCGVMLAWYWYRTPLALPRAPFDFEVRAGATLSAVARQLHEAGVVPYPLALVALGRLEGVDRSIKAGTRSTRGSRCRSSSPSSRRAT